MEDIQYVKNRVSYIITEFGDSQTEFNTKDINRLLDQLGIEEQQNEMLIKECLDLKKENELQQEHLMHNEAELIPLREKFQRLQDNVLIYQEKIEELKQAVKWALNNCKPERDELHCDFFNILTNAVQ